MLRLSLSTSEILVRDGGRHFEHKDDVKMMQLTTRLTIFETMTAIRVAVQ